MRYTLAVTSCNRFDLLKKTLESFAQHADLWPESTVIVEDSDAPMPAWVPQLHGLKFGAITWINTGRRGQIFALDTLYSNIKTEGVFHLEDDWLFTDGPFVGPSFRVLERYPNIWTVSLRGKDCNGHPLEPYAQPTPGGPLLFMNVPGWRGGWGGCHFNPGARRLSDYRRIGSYGRHVGYGHHGCGHELALSKLHLELGYRIAVLQKYQGCQDPFIHHLGAGLSKAVEPIPAPPKILLAVPAAQDYNYGPHSLSVPREVSGRVEAVRATWFKDAAKFRNVDARFFYGRPVRDWREDEVFLNCPDDYPSLPLKVQEICKYALHHGYDYLVKADDDTVIYLDRLLRSGFDRPGVDQMGFFNCKHAPGDPRCKCYATGMCYTLSRRAMALVAKGGPPIHWAEDLNVGAILRSNGIRPVHNPGIVPGFGAHYVKFPLPEGAIAAHSVKPDTMGAWYASLSDFTSTGLVAQLKGTSSNDIPELPEALR